MPDATDNGVLAGQPWWVRLVLYFGAPTAVMVWLLWFILDILSVKLDTIINMQWRIYTMTKGHCQNVAKTDQQYNRCQTPWDKAEQSKP